MTPKIFSAFSAAAKGLLGKSFTNFLNPFNPEISGSKNQEILDQYTKIRKRFQNERLEFIKKDFDAKKANDQALIIKLEKDYNGYVSVNRRPISKAGIFEYLGSSIGAEDTNKIYKV